VLLAAASVACPRRSRDSEGARPPKAAAPEPTTAAASAQAPKLCAHGVPGDLCTKCNPDLIAVYKDTGDWCNEHGLPESQCKRCNPELDFSKPAAPADWCTEHGVPESKCTKCNPALVARFIAAGDYCRDHGFPRSVCPRCNPKLAAEEGHPAPVFPPEGTIVRLASAESVREAGIQTAPVRVRPFGEVLSVVGRIEFDQNHLAQLSARGEAVIVTVHVDVGQTVRAGQPLVTLTSPSVGEARARLLAARARLEAARSGADRQKALLDARVSSVRDLEAAQQELAAAQGDHFAASAALRGAGATPGSKGGQYTLSAPFAGTVVTRDAVAGRTAAAGDLLVEVADLSTLWTLLDIPEEDALAVQVGQRVTLALEARRDETLEGVIDRVGAKIDPRSRAVQARVLLPNRDGRLKAGLFVRADIQVTSPRQAILIPREAVQRAEGQALVFVRTGETTFKPVPVETGAVTAREIEIRKGLQPGSEVVTTAAFLLKTEILKDSIGAGCCDIEEKK
jgi:membrane fusion protein, heavy metal efflux system